MTTIAFKDGVLAADTLITCNGNIARYGQKIHRVGRLLIGAAGSGAMYEAFRDWVVAGMTGSHPIKSDLGNCFIIRPDGCAICWCDDGPFRMPDVWAMGSGDPIAMGAMLSGKSARQAVAIAAKHDTRTGGKITVLKL